MPYHWSTSPDEVVLLRLWPNRSLSRRGFVLIVGVTAFLLTLPLLAVVGTALLWGLLPFAVGVVAFLYWAVTRSWRDGELTEELRISADTVTLTRSDPRGGPAQTWQANPHWVRVEIHADKGPVEQYLTLTGNGRTVEIGVFLSPEEREALEPELRRALAGEAPS